jgi:hypothetical protein
LARLARLRDVHPTYWERAIPLLAELRAEFVEEVVHSVRFDVCDSLFIHTSAAPVPADPAPRLCQHIRSIDLVIQDAERPARRFLGRTVKLSLKYSHWV